MKFLESAGKISGSVRNKWVSSTTVHTFWNHSLQNHKSDWIKTLITTTKKCSHRGQTQTLRWIQPDYFARITRWLSPPSLPNKKHQLVRLRRNSRITSFIPTRFSVYYAYFNVNRQTTAIRRRRLMSKNNEDSSSNKTSVKLNFALDRTSYSALRINGKTEHQNSYTRFHHLCSQAEELRHLVEEKTCRSLGDEWKGVPL